jgi:hypothetical protein
VPLEQSERPVAEEGVEVEARIVRLTPARFRRLIAAAAAAEARPAPPPPRPVGPSWAA